MTYGLGEIVDRVRACKACSRMCYSHVLGPANGPAPADVMLIGEAPGRLGAAITGVPFSGDESGKRFEELLGVAGLRRDEAFVTNAVLCNPVDGQGRNRPPLVSELDRCRPFLEAQLEAVRPRIVIALGKVALAALSRIESHGASLRGDCGRELSWSGRTLVALYHPGRRALVHRSQSAQEEDWRTLGRMIQARPWLNERLSRTAMVDTQQPGARRKDESYLGRRFQPTTPEPLP